MATKLSLDTRVSGLYILVCVSVSIHLGVCAWLPSYLWVHVCVEWQACGVCVLVVCGGSACVAPCMLLSSVRTRAGWGRVWQSVGQATAHTPPTLQSRDVSPL